MSFVTATGWANVSVCQPLVDSLVKVPVASAVPDVDHSVPVCVPVLLAPL